MSCAGGDFKFMSDEQLQVQREILTDVNKLAIFILGLGDARRVSRVSC